MIHSIDILLYIYILIYICIILPKDSQRSTWQRSRDRIWEKSNDLWTCLHSLESNERLSEGPQIQEVQCCFTIGRNWPSLLVTHRHPFQVRTFPPVNHGESWWIHSIQTPSRDELATHPSLSAIVLGCLRHERGSLHHGLIGHGVPCLVDALKRCPISLRSQTYLYHSIPISDILR